MFDYEKVGKRIAILRKEKGLTGERLAESLGISPQAISKWENGKCLPETILLPDLAKALDCSIDALLVPKELLILEAAFTDGQTSIPITQLLNNIVYDNKLNICVNNQSISAWIDGDRLKLVTLKYQTPSGTFYTFALQNDMLYIDLTTSGVMSNTNFKFIGAYYGNAKKYASAMRKMEHYEYFKWNKIHVNHETFPSNTASDDVEYLTLIYLNRSGIHTISCAENDALHYGENRTTLFLKDNTSCILPEIIHLNWEEEMDCPWAGALYASLKYMGESYSYEQIMGLSGACYRIGYVDVWDWSCTDALIAFDYSTILFDAIGYEPVWADRLEKDGRKAERQAIMRDIQNGKPIIAMNLRVAPEWGVITGYLENGNEFLCRTYFDKPVFDEWENETCDKPEDKKLTFSERGGYLINDFWPYMIVHFGDKKETPTPMENLTASLKALIDSFDAPPNRGYHQGKAAYEAWIKGLSDEATFTNVNDKEGIDRRLGVNDSILLALIDARRCAECYLRENIFLLPEDKQSFLIKIADNYEQICKRLADFRSRIMLDCNISSITYNTVKTNGVSTEQLRQEQIALLKQMLVLEQENVEMAALLLQ